MIGRVRFSEISEDECLTLHHLINYFQDCSTFHLEDTGMGNYFKERDLAIYFLSWQIEINRLPKLGEEIKVGTLVYEMKGMFGYRNYILLGEDDEVLAYANLCGCFVNSKTGQLFKLDVSDIEKFSIEPKWEMTYLPRKIKPPKEEIYKEPIQINRFQIDTNNHLNNSQYVAIAFEYLPKDKKIKQVRVDYKKAAKLGDVLIPALAKEDNLYYVTLCDEELNPYAIITFQT